MQETKDLSYFYFCQNVCEYVCVSFKTRSENVTIAFSKLAQPPLNPPVFEVVLCDSHFGKVIVIFFSIPLK